MGTKMSEYINRLQISIDDKLMRYAMNRPCSIIDLHILYHHHIKEISTLFYNPRDHYSKIMLLSYKRVIK